MAEEAACQCVVPAIRRFWGILETRPYMRALMGLAQTLVELGRVNEALAQFRELLRLNPNDNQGVRYPLLSELVRAQREDEAVAYVENFCDVWRETPGAVEWIQRQAITHKSGNRRHRGGRSTGRQSRRRR